MNKSIRRPGARCMRAAVALVAASCSLAAQADPNLVNNGDFADGTLSGWSTYTTVNGDLIASVSPFDTAGSGTSNAATLVGGQTVADFFGPFGGGGLSQSFTASGGNLQISADVATQYTGSFSNSAALFELLVDGVVLDSFDAAAAGNIASGEVRRDTLGAVTSLAAGSHVLRIQVTRGFRTHASLFNYVDNVVVTAAVASPVPEPSSLVLAGLGVAALVARTRGRR
ncbi:putative PEP-CTERM domain-containing protein [Rubrivivax sp. A210]|uniref:PEP-CTERM sorting domain-containing protein n=1 Tax=Rubrivivax sp. A210 TaxID=2772301 RepID=UPI001918F957|nr:PEP-CTERM sorting domain-containing protein [Rubrivivax sp. A210]CAD5369745.1 putative PEP-CTERM domain-containing protein [Rubrivivax sp. A210]